MDRRPEKGMGSTERTASFVRIDAWLHLRPILRSPAERQPMPTAPDRFAIFVPTSRVSVIALALASVFTRGAAI
jgi:hypothetical protein